MLSTLKMIPTKLKHKKLSENYIEAEPVVIEGISYTAKYVGMTLLDSPKGEEMAAGAIKRIVASNKASPKDSPAVMLTVSPKGIQVKDTLSNEVIDNVDISRISFCTADKAFGKVFGYVAQNEKTETFECHAYMCGSRKEAQKLALTVAQSFSIAYEVSHSEKEDDISQLEGETSSSGFSLDNKKISSIYRSIADSRYKRLSDSFTTGSETAGSETVPHEEKVIQANEKGEVMKPEYFNFEVFKVEPTLPTNVPSQPTVTVTSVEIKNEVKISILPPPSSRGKQQAKRISPRPTPTADLIDISAAFAERTMISSETEKIDLDFAQLAISRTKHTS